MPTTLYLFFSGIIGYLLGAIPVGYLLVKVTKRVDIRSVGSGRTGGTNSFRAAGTTVGVLTSIGDVLKAACAVWLVRALFSGPLPGAWAPWSEALAGVMSVVGHNWSIYIGWHGGAGTGPNVGWAGAIWLPVVPVALIVVLGAILLIGMASIASLSMAVIIPIAFIILYLAGVTPYDQTVAYMVGGLIAAAFVVWALRPNVKRLLTGQERLVGPRARRRQRRAAEQSREG